MATDGAELAWLFDLVPVPPSSRARYTDIAEIARTQTVGSPIHVAIHQVDAAVEADRAHCELHRHPFGEVNILVGDDGALRYRIVVGDDSRVVSSPAVVWIPPHVTHSANLLEGSGTFIALYVREPEPDDHE